MALDATVGGATANSYPTVDEADSFNEMFPDGGTWADADDAVKEGSLIMATLRIDIMPAAWTGAAATEVQALGWPRRGMKNRNGFSIAEDVVPDQLKASVIEFARRLQSGSIDNADNDVFNQALKSLSVGSVSLSFDLQELAKRRDGNIVSGVLPGFTLPVPDLVLAMLVPSWLKPTIAQETASNTKTLFFEVL